MRQPIGPLIIRYIAALAGPALAIGVRLLLDPLLGNQFPFATLFLAVLLAAWFGGFGPALLASVTGALVSAWVLLPPHGSLTVPEWGQSAGIALYLVVSLGIALLGGAMRAGRQRAQLRAELVAEDREKLRVTLASIGDAVAITDARGQVVSLNGVAQTLTGWSQDDARGRPIEEVFAITNETTGQPVENPVGRVLLEGRIVGLANHTVLTARNGQQYAIDDSAAPIRDDSGEVRGVILVFRDVTEQRRAEQALRESEERHRLIAELTTDYVTTCRVEESGSLVLESVTEGFSKVTGYSLEEVEARGGWTVLVHPEDVPTVNQSVGRWLTNQPDSREVRIFTREGETRWLNYLGRLVDSPGEHHGGQRLLVAAQDVTVRKSQELAIEERVRLAAFVKDVALALNQADTLPDMLRHCAEALVTHLRGAFARIWILNEVESVLELRASAGLYTHLDGPHGRVPVGKFKIGLIAQERKPHLTNSVVGDPRVGDQDWARREQMVAFAGYPLLVEDRLVGVVGMFAREPLSDNTLDAMALVASSIASGIQRKQAQDLAREQKEWLRVTLASIGDAVITTDIQGRVTFLNPVAEELTGWPLVEAMGQPLDSVFPICNEITRQKVESPVARVLQEGRAVGLANHTVLLTRDGLAPGWRPIDDSAAPIKAADGSLLGVVLVFRDVTTTRRIENQRNARLATTQVLSQATTVAEASTGVLRGVCESLHWDIGFFWTQEERLGLLACRDSWVHPGAPPVNAFEATSRQQTFGKGTGLPGQVWSTGKPQWILDVNHVPNFPRASVAAKEGLHGALACPIAVSGEVYGVLEFFSRQVREPDADLLEMMNTVAGQFGQFLERMEAESRLRQSERELADFFDNATEGLHWVGPDGTILRANQAELDLLGYTVEEYVGHKISEFHADQEVIEDILRRLKAGEELQNYEARLRCKDGSTRYVLINSNVMHQEGKFHHTRCFTRDVTERKRGEAVLAGQKCVLELLVQGAPLADVLDALCQIVEGQSQKPLVASVLLLEEDTHCLRSVAGRRLPVAYSQAIDGVRIGPGVGSCGTAAYLGKPIIVPDIATHPLWADFRDLALGHGLRSCWSTPIFSSENKVLGTFAVYHFEPSQPAAEEIRLVEILTRTAGVAVERRQAEDALREADRRKDEFLATLAHELRNPLAPMRNALQVIQLAGGDKVAVGQAREMMERQMRHMVRLVDDLLDVSRITRAKLELRKQQVDLATVLHTAVEASRPLVDSLSHELILLLPPQPIFVDGDPVRLAQVFSNLLNNAAKYTDRGGKIWLSAERQGSDAVVSVRDTGLGIPREMLGKVFDLFTQVDRTLEKAQGGLGIGLTLVRRLTEMHGGSVEARSEGSGMGSEFIVRLPAVLVAPVVDEGNREADSPSSRRRILVVDDNRDSAISLAMILQLMGNEVRTAHDGLQAVEVADVFLPHVVLLDIGLPRLNGYEVARRLREQAWGKEAVLIAVTGWGQEEDRRRSREAGFNFHMVKPVEPASLEKLLSGLLTAVRPGVEPSD